MIYLRDCSCDVPPSVQLVSDYDAFNFGASFLAFET